MEIKEIIDDLRVCADDDIICPACPRYESSVNSGSAECFEELMMEAADAIESQQKRIAELEAALREQEERRWIPVEERPPEPAVPVFLKSEYGIRSGYRLHKKWTDFFVIEVADGLYRGGTATHWTPMPELPKEDANAKMQ